MARLFGTRRLERGLVKLIPLKGGAEYDALTRWKRFENFRAGERRWVKRKYNKRVRKEGKKCHPLACVVFYLSKVKTKPTGYLYCITETTRFSP